MTLYNYYFRVHPSLEKILAQSSHFAREKTLLAPLLCTFVSIISQTAPVLHRFFFLYTSRWFLFYAARELPCSEKLHFMIHAKNFFHFFSSFPDSFCVYFSKRDLNRASDKLILKMLREYRICEEKIFRNYNGWDENIF